MNTHKQCKLPSCGKLIEKKYTYCKQHGNGKAPKNLVTPYKCHAITCPHQATENGYCVNHQNIAQKTLSGETVIPTPTYICNTCTNVYPNNLDLCPQCHNHSPHFVKIAPMVTGDKPKYNIEDFQQNRNTKYDREIVGLCGTKVMVDVYRVQDAFPANSPMVDHVNKKSLANGSRGHKSMLEDLIDMRDSINSAIVLHLQKYGEE